VNYERGRKTPEIFIEPEELARYAKAWRELELYQPRMARWLREGKPMKEIAASLGWGLESLKYFLKARGFSGRGKRKKEIYRRLFGKGVARVLGNECT